MMVYVSAPTKSRVRAARVVRRLREIGAEIVRDWTADETPVDTPEAETQRAEATRHAIERCVVLVSLPGWAPSARGAYTELGLALALGKTCVVVHGGVRRGVLLLAQHHARHPLQALDQMHRLMGGGPLPDYILERWRSEDEARKLANGGNLPPRETPKAAPAPPPLPKALKIAPEALQAKGGRMKATLLGRHVSEPERFDGYVMLRVPGRVAGMTFPKGVPEPQTPEEYRLIVATKQWAKVEAALARDYADRFVAEGVPVVEGDAIVLHVMGITTCNLQREAHP